MDPMTAYYGFIATSVLIIATFIGVAVGYPLFLIWRAWQRERHGPE